MQCCVRYRGIKLMSHTMKIWERIIEARLRDRDQYTGIWIYSRKGNYRCHVCLKNVDGKMQERSKRATFVDLEKACDRVPREELWYCMRKSGMAEKFLSDLYRT